jgi:hypothetical protein
MMIKASYEQIVDRISKTSGLNKEEVVRRIGAKKAKFSDLISDEGAAQIVAAELGVTFEKQTLKIVDLMMGMKKISVIGKIVDEPMIRGFKRQQQDAEVVSFSIADETSNVRVVLWDTNHISMIKNGTLKNGSVIEIKNADIRGTANKEIHLNSFSELMPSKVDIQAVVMTKESPIVRKIKDIKTNEKVNVRANILQMFNISFFYVCPECNMKATFEGEKAVCPKHGAIMPRKRAILNVTLDDGSENIRATAFNELILKIFNLENESQLDDPNIVLEKREELLGEEFIFLGRTRKNVLFNRDEFIISDVEKVSADDVIKIYSKAN